MKFEAALAADEGALTIRLFSCKAWSTFASFPPGLESCYYRALGALSPGLVSYSALLCTRMHASLLRLQGCNSDRYEDYNIPSLCLSQTYLEVALIVSSEIPPSPPAHLSPLLAFLDPLFWLLRPSQNLSSASPSTRFSHPLLCLYFCPLPTLWPNPLAVRGWLGLTSLLTPCLLTSLLPACEPCLCLFFFQLSLSLASPRPHGSPETTCSSLSHLAGFALFALSASCVPAHSAGAAATAKSSELTPPLLGWTDGPRGNLPFC